MVVGAGAGMGGLGRRESADEYRVSFCGDVNVQN